MRKSFTLLVDDRPHIINNPKWKILSHFAFFKTCSSPLFSTIWCYYETDWKTICFEKQADFDNTHLFLIHFVTISYHQKGIENIYNFSNDFLFNVIAKDIFRQDNLLTPFGFYYFKTPNKKFVILYSFRRFCKQPLMCFWHDKTQKESVSIKSINYLIRPRL